MARVQKIKIGISPLEDAEVEGYKEGLVPATLILGPLLEKFNEDSLRLTIVAQLDTHQFNQKKGWCMIYLGNEILAYEGIIQGNIFVASLPLSVR